jgi:signal transduction histidine kinase
MSGERTGIGPVRLRPPRKRTSLILPLATAILAAVTFALDTVTDYEIAVSTFYVVIVLLSLGFCRGRGIVYVSGACILLTISSYGLTAYVTPHGDYRAGLINTGIGILAIGATAYLAMKIEHAREIASQAQAQLAHVVRLTTMGELAASIAHEVNQPLTAVVTNANACARWLDAQPPNLDKASFSINEIVGAANRASQIIARVRSLTKRVDPRKDWIDINDAAAEIVQLTRQQFEDAHVTLRMDFAPYLPMVHGDRVQLQQVVLNLLINALESVVAVRDGERGVLVRSSRPEPNQVMLAIRDSGCGIDSTAAGRLFDAFYSTKAEGMGIGLAICRSIIEAHGGRIWASPNRPRGATFSFTLPGDDPALP